LAIAYAFLANAHLAPERDSGGDFLAEVVEWFGELERDLVVAEMKSAEFENAFFEEQKTLITVEHKRGEGPAELLRFEVAVKSWNVYRIDQEVIRGLWSNAIRDYFFFGRADPEGRTHQENSFFLNNIIHEACDVPIGYPALTTPFIESLVNPWAGPPMAREG
jgi:hypothetical protein